MMKEKKSRTWMTSIKKMTMFSAIDRLRSLYNEYKVIIFNINVLLKN